LRKEVQIHAVLKHENVLEFLGVEEHLKESANNHVPGLYMVLELEEIYSIKLVSTLEALPEKLSS
jgi:hypothetical protein